MKAYLLLGSNIGDRSGNLKRALNLIRSRVAPINRESSIYETAPWGNYEQPVFLNQAIAIETGLEPELLLKRLKSIEKLMGRKQADKWGARIIDIDILLMDDLIYQSESLRVPHPQMHHRRFTLVPLAEIAPDVIHPEFNSTMQSLLSLCKDQLEVHLFSPPAVLPSSSFPK